MKSEKIEATARGPFWRIPEKFVITDTIRNTLDNLIQNEKCPEIIVSELINLSAHYALLYCKHPQSKMRKGIEALNAEIASYEPVTRH